MPRFESENSWSLGQLFAGFMQHYDRNFDFTADVASVRTGRILPNAQCEAHARAVKNGVGQWKAYVCVEEPFERSNAARYVRSSSRPADAKKWLQMCHFQGCVPKGCLRRHPVLFGQGQSVWQSG